MKLWRIARYALDGFPLMAPYECTDDDCSELKKLESSYVQISDPTLGNSWDAHEYIEGHGDLDACNGKFGDDGQYRYYATDTFSYFIGCYKGEVDVASQGGAAGAGNGGPPGPSGPPQ